MIVVSNASPLTNLAAVGQFDLLRRLYTNLLIPELRPNLVALRKKAGFRNQYVTRSHLSCA
jgi:predicted nucleic acid-binding protein